jgi:hypothetical protein
MSLILNTNQIILIVNLLMTQVLKATIVFCNLLIYAQLATQFSSFMRKRLLMYFGIGIGGFLVTC